MFPGVPTVGWPSWPESGHKNLHRQKRGKMGIRNCTDITWNYLGVHRENMSETLGNYLPSKAKPS